MHTAHTLGCSVLWFVLNNIINKPRGYFAGTILKERYLLNQFVKHICSEGGTALITVSMTKDTNLWQRTFLKTAALFVVQRFLLWMTKFWLQVAADITIWWLKHLSWSSRLHNLPFVIFIIKSLFHPYCICLMLGSIMPHAMPALMLTILSATSVRNQPASGAPYLVFYLITLHKHPIDRLWGQYMEYFVSCVVAFYRISVVCVIWPQIGRFMGPTWGPPGSCRHVKLGFKECCFKSLLTIYIA